MPVLKPIPSSTETNASQDAEIDVAGERLVCHASGVAYWPTEQALLVSDLHLEKGTAFARRGVLLPPYDTRTTLQRLIKAIERHNPKTVFSLGDAFHDLYAEARMDTEDKDLLGKAVRMADWVWITGNHDPAPPNAPGHVCSEIAVGKLRLVHEPADGCGVDGEVAGHLHPAAKVLASGKIMRRRCFVTNGRRLILPAFGAYTGGLNILDDAFESVFENPTAWVLGARGVYPFSGRKLLPDT